MASARPSADVLQNWIPLVAALAVADITSMFEGMMIVAALTHLIAIYHDAVLVGWLVTSYLLVAAASTALASRLGDLYGHRLVLCVVLALTVLGSAISFLSEDLGWVIFGRGVQGVSAAILPLGMGLVRRHVPQHRISLSVGLLLSASGIAATVGLLVGGLLVDSWGWRYIFAFSGAFALLSWVLVAIVAPRTAPPRQSGPLDLVGGVLFAPAMAAIVYAIGETGGDGGWAMALVCLAGGAGLLVAWYLHERRHPNPLIDVRLLMSPLGASLNICTAIWAFSVLQLTQTQMIFLQQPIATGVGLGLTATMAAMVKMPAKAITMFVAPIAGQLSEVVGPRRIVFSGFVLAAIGWALLALSHHNLWFVATVMALFCAMGITVIYTGLNTAAVLGAPIDRTSEVVGMTMVTRMIFQAVGAQTVMTILDKGAKAGGGYPRESDYLILFALISAMAAVGAFASLRLPGRRDRPEPAVQLAAS